MRWAEAVPRAIFADHNDVLGLISSVCLAQGFVCVQSPEDGPRGIRQGHGDGPVRLLFPLGHRSYYRGL